MLFFLISLAAGALTVLAPCILPLLPVVLGASAADSTNRMRPLIIVASLGASIFIFTFLLKAYTALIMIPDTFWKWLSGGILMVFGATLVFPILWEQVSMLFPGASRSANKLLAEGYQKKSVTGDMVVGAALGPVFSTCSPTYFVILASVLPESFALGVLYILGYIFGLATVLLAIAYFGQRIIGKLNIAADPRGWFKRGLGMLFVMLGLAVALGYDKKLETAILDAGFFDVTGIEQRLLEKNAAANTDDAQNTTGSDQKYPRYAEIQSPSGFVNTDGVRIGDLVGKKVILVDFMTYSCINCQRTFPYMVAWYDRYKDDGLEIVGIHTPEFAFEKDIANVREAMKKFGITYPVVLDNDYATWRAWGNQFWPRKYLIDIHGNVVYDHIGEGKYDETEAKIRALLQERHEVLGESETLSEKSAEPVVGASASAGPRSPETYFGALRNSTFVNGTPGKETTDTFVLPKTLALEGFYLDGTWRIEQEFAAPAAAGAALVFRFRAQDVYLVAGSKDMTTLRILIDGVPVLHPGADVKNGALKVQTERLYHLFHDPQNAGAHTLRIEATAPGAELYTFTFG